MAWNGAVGTQAPPYQQQQQPPPQYSNNSHQPQQYNQQGYSQPPPGQQYNQQPPYGQQQHQHQHQPPYQQHPYNQGQYQHNRPPNQSYLPKRKGNPVITRYAPPPGYHGSQQQGASYGQNQYQQPSPQGYGPPQGFQQPLNYPTNQNYQQPQGNYPPQQGYQQPSNYQQAQSYNQPPQYQGGYQQPPQPNHHNQNYQQPPNYQGPQGYPPPQGSYQQGYPPQGYHGNQEPTAPHQQYPSHQQWQNQSHQGPYPNDQYGTYGHQAQDQNSGPLTGHTDQSSPMQSQQPSSAVSRGSENPAQKGELYLAWDDWDFDFDGALWPKGNDAIDPNLSIGIIVWHPATQATRALPSDYANAEKQALRPPAKKLDNGESISEYFRVDNSHEAFLDIRQTDHWDQIKDDIIFFVFPRKSEGVALDDVIANRDRPDWPTTDDETIDRDESSLRDPTWNVMDNLEQALSAGGRGGSYKAQRTAGPGTPSRTNQRTYSRDQGQEDALARLGVTGSPKPVEDMAEPAAVPQTPEKTSPGTDQRFDSLARVPPQPVYGPTTGLRPPPPPEPERSPSYDPWKADQPPRTNGHSNNDGSRRSPAGSEGSQHTLAGEDFSAETKSDNRKNGNDLAMDDLPPSHRPSLPHSESSASRKRSYEESESNSDDKQRQQDDVTPRHKRRQPQVAAAYSRRW